MWRPLNYTDNSVLQNKSVDPARNPLFISVVTLGQVMCHWQDYKVKHLKGGIKLQYIAFLLLGLDKKFNFHIFFLCKCVCIFFFFFMVLQISFSIIPL